MEKTLSSDERIKRAEEIYYRRKMQNTSRKSTKVNVSNKKDFRMFRKMILQIFICIFIYLIFYMVKNTNYIFSEDVINKTREILLYDINIKNIFEQGMQYINSFSNDVGASSARPQEENSIESSSIIENQINENEINQSMQSQNTNSAQEENIGGENIAVNTEETVELTQMEQDVKDILASKSLIIPLKGTITSRFGLRNPETPTVPKNHTGIDIAVNEGTVFIASMSGTVEEVSSEGDLGNHFKIVSDDVMTVYAHCKTIYVKEGDKVIKGQAIGEVGSTGNSTGPHLHFEIRKNNRYVDPDLILQF